MIGLITYFPKEKIKSAKNILKEFHGKLLIYEKIDNVKVLTISLFMICNKHKKAEVKKDEVKELYNSFGRNDFNKAIYELTGKRKKTSKIKTNRKKNPTIIENKDMFCITKKALDVIDTIIPSTIKR
jgi:hypothetical protein